MPYVAPITPDEARELTASEEAYRDACVDVMNPLIQERFESWDVSPVITLAELAGGLEGNEDVPYQPDSPRIRRALIAVYGAAGWIVEYESRAEVEGYFRFSEKDPSETQSQ